MLAVLVIVGVVSGALVVGAVVGVRDLLPAGLERFLVGVAGGALVVAAVAELVEPAAQATSDGLVIGLVLLGAGVFTIVDNVVDERWQRSDGAGMLVSITVDGIPENVALGVALIGADPVDVAALGGSILLANLPEAAGGASRMVDEGIDRSTVVGLWVATAVALSVAAVLGNLLLAGASDALLAGVRAVAAGAVVASLATEVFPRAYEERDDTVGIAAGLGVAIAFGLHALG